MYRERLVATDVHTENAHRLKRLLLEYHDFRQHKAGHPLRDEAHQVADWQAERLKTPTRIYTVTRATTPAWNFC